MNLFKKKILPHKLSWWDITLDQYKKIKTLNLSLIENQITAAEVLLGINADELTWGEFNKELKKLDFLSTPIPKSIIRFTYKLNGHSYRCCPRVDELSVSQFMDFQKLVSTGELEKILAIFLIPEGKEYGDYDINIVYEDILTMSIVDVLSISNFFLLMSKVLFNTMTDYSIQKLKELKKKKVKEGLPIEDIQKIMEYCSTEYLTISELLQNGQI